MLDALALDPDFLSWRAPWILPLWAAYFVLYVFVLRAGRWSVLALRISSLLSLLTVGVLLWWIAGGPIFTSEDADSTTKFLLAAIGVTAAIGVAVMLRRSWLGPRRV